MKNLILLICSAIFLIHCKKEDDNVNITPPSIEGKWYDKENNSTFKFDTAQKVLLIYEGDEEKFLRGWNYEYRNDSLFFNSLKISVTLTHQTMGLFYTQQFGSYILETELNFVRK